MRYLSNKETLEKIMDLYLNDVYRICFYFTKDQETSAEITRKVLTEFYDSLSKWDLILIRKSMQEDKLILRELAKKALREIDLYKREKGSKEGACGDVKKDSRVPAE